MAKTVNCRGFSRTLTWLLIGISVIYATYFGVKQLVLVHGGYTEWSEFTLCSKSCEGGTSTRIRTCTNPIPKWGGMDCSKHGPFIETKDCNVHLCPVDGKYGPWENFGSCSVTCGGGTKSRVRKCDSPAPKHGGKDCIPIGSHTEDEQCNKNPCPVNGGFTDWGSWTKCSATCGDGKKTRSRSCTKPAPAEGGKSCKDQKLGEPNKTATCNNTPCLIPTTKLPTARGNLSAQNLKT